MLSCFAFCPVKLLEQPDSSNKERWNWGAAGGKVRAMEMFFPTFINPFTPELKKYILLTF